MAKQWFYFWLVTGLEGLFACGLMLALPSDQGKAFLLGLSVTRFLLFCILLAVAVGCFIYARRIHLRSAPDATRIAAEIPPGIGWVALWLFYLLSIALAIYVSPLRAYALVWSLFQRLAPLILWMALFSLQSFILLFLRYKTRRGLSAPCTKQKKAIFLAVAVFLLSVSGILLSLKTGLGLEIISGTFYRQGVSLLEGQFILPLLIVFPIMITMAALQKRLSVSAEQKRDWREKTRLLIPGLIWLVTAIFWIQTPFEGRSYFVPALRAPNFNFYPSSDAESYDMLAQSILVGNGFRNGMTVVRPLYVAFLALLHLLAGNDYLLLTNLQIIVLAALPAVLYLIGREIGHPMAGFIAAVWMLLREAESIRLTPLIQVSNSRLLMSDLPMTLIVCLIVLFATRWVRDSGNPNIIALTTGGFCGVGMLIRTQSFVLLPAVLIFFLSGKIAMKSMTRKKIVQCLLALAGCLLVVAPWQLWNRLSPNESLSGETSETDYLYRLYERAAFDGAPLEGLEELGDNEKKPSLFGLIFQKPGKIFAAFSAHFLNNELSTLLVLPVRTIQPDTVARWFHEPSLFWYRQSSRSALVSNPFLILVYLALICIGIGSAFRRAGPAGLLSLWIHLVYNAGTSAALNSGFRFVLPVDWVDYFYLACGVTVGMEALLRLVVGANRESISGIASVRLQHRPYAVWGTTVCLALVGLILPSLELVVPFRYQERLFSENELIQIVSAASAGQPCCSAQQLGTLLDENKLQIFEGRAVYPRLYQAHEGDSGGGVPVKQWADYDRLVWMMVNRGVTVVSLQVDSGNNVAPIPDPMDVALIGVADNGTIDAWWVVSTSDHGQKIWQSSQLEMKIGATER